MGSSIVVAFPKLEDAKKIRAVLEKHGLEVVGTATAGSGVLSILSGLDYGVLVCGYHLADLYYRDLLADLPPGFEMILVASERVIREAPLALVCIPLPLSRVSLLEAVETVLTSLERRYKKKKKAPFRPKAEQEVIDQAKAVLMEKSHMSEQEAHRYLQKTSMDSGNSLFDTAQMVLLLF